MKKILIIYPHWPPSNLAGVHRARLIANFLHEFDYQPIVLTVEHTYYEEEPDRDMVKTVSPRVEVIYTKAYPVLPIRIIGDIGLRAFPFLYKKALEIIRTRKIDFIWIPIPSFYTALLGRKLYKHTGIPYGIDYIDPWVRDISNRSNLRAVLSLWAAQLLEPYAIKKAALISGVSEKYFLPAIKRNFKAHNQPLQVAMPYGFDPHDHQISPSGVDLPWADIPHCQPLVYAGAFLPNAAYFTQKLFAQIRRQIEQGAWNENRHLFFLGTGNYPHKPVSEFARDAGISGYVHEIRQRFPFLHILHFLSKAYGVLVIGSTEEHYTASKIYQSLLSQRPVFAVFHYKSTVCNVMQECHADNYLVKYHPKQADESFVQQLAAVWEKFTEKDLVWQPDLTALDKYSARQSAKVLVEGIEKALTASKR